VDGICNELGIPVIVPSFFGGVGDERSVSNLGIELISWLKFWVDVFVAGMFGLSSGTETIRIQ